MAANQKVEAELRLYPGAASIVIGGKDIADSVQSFVLRVSAGNLPQLQLNLLTPLVDLDGEVQVTIPGATRNALVQLGWTPPATEGDD